MLLLSLIAASSDALLFKRGRVGHSGWSKGKNLGKDKVRVPNVEDGMVFWVNPYLRFSPKMVLNVL